MTVGLEGVVGKERAAEKMVEEGRTALGAVVECFEEGKVEEEEEDKRQNWDMKDKKTEEVNFVGKMFLGDK